MSADSFTFTLTAPFGSDLKIVRLEGREEAGKLFEFRIEFIDYVDGGAANGEPITSEDAIGMECSVKWEFGWSGAGFSTGVDLTRDVHGFCASFRVLGTLSGYFYYEIILRPRLWLAGRKTNSRLFLDQTLEQIITTVLEDSDVEKRFEFAHSSDTIHYVVQYQETDLDFIHRLLEKHGSTYFFEHTESAHTAVFRDASGELSAAGEIAYLHDTGGIVPDRYISNVSMRAGLFSDEVAMRDWDYESAGAPLEAENTMTRQHGSSGNEVFLYPGGWSSQNNAHGADLARFRTEAEVADSKRIMLTGYVPDFTPGKSFSVGENPARVTGGYVLLKAHHVVDVMANFRSDDRFKDDDDKNFGYVGTYEAVPSDIPYPPRRTTPWPCIPGPQTAIVTGDGEIDVDDQGRITVLFHWDRDQTPSRRIRVAQVWAGTGWGGMIIPRVGQEVVVQFIGGDPDRPLVTGAVYNSEHDLPYTLPDDKTKSTLKSETSEGGGGFNELRFEDLAGSEEIYIHAQKDMFREILNDDTLEIGNDQTITITNNRTGDVGNDDTWTIGNNLSIEATSQIELKVGGSTITITSDTIEINSMNVKLNGSTMFEAKGLRCTVDGSAQTTIKGGMVNIN